MHILKRVGKLFGFLAFRLPPKKSELLFDIPDRCYTCNKCGGCTKMYEWQEIEQFPGYSVSREGSVRNDRTGRYLRASALRSGVVSVGLMRNKVQHKRSVALLVAHAFINTARSITFDTPINLDGDRFNNCVENLLWRPRWFAFKYFQQFKAPSEGICVPVEEMESHECFKTSWDAAIRYGLLDKDILLSTANETYVWPTYQRFRVI